MAEEHLDNANIRPELEPLSGEGVAQGVRRHAFAELRLHHRLAEILLHDRRRHGAVEWSSGTEQRLRRSLSDSVSRPTVAVGHHSRHGAASSNS